MHVAQPFACVGKIGEYSDWPRRARRMAVLLMMMNQGQKQRHNGALLVDAV